MKRLLPGLLGAAGLLLVLTSLAAPAAAEDVVVPASVVKIVDANNVTILMPKGKYRGHWNLELRGGARGFKVGQRGRIHASSDVLDRKKGSVTARGFKGSDEELQAIIDWLGSLEAQEPG